MLGEGYGATLAGLAMAQDRQGVIGCAALVNPLTDWTLVGQQDNL